MNPSPLADDMLPMNDSNGVTSNGHHANGINGTAVNGKAQKVE